MNQDSFHLSRDIVNITVNISGNQRESITYKFTTRMRAPLVRTLVGYEVNASTMQFLVHSKTHRERYAS